MLAMDARTPRCVRHPALTLTTIASLLAPTTPTKELEISTLRPIVASAAALKNLHQTGKISRT